jgi:hypothetical protein
VKTKMASTRARLVNQSQAAWTPLSCFAGPPLDLLLKITGSSLILTRVCAKAVPAYLRGARVRKTAPAPGAASLQCTMRENDAGGRTPVRLIFWKDFQS